MDTRQRELQNETLESISQFNDLSIDDLQHERSPNKGNVVGDKGSELDDELKEEEVGNGTDSDSSLNIKNSNFVESTTNSNGEETVDQDDEVEDVTQGADDSNDDNDNGKLNEYNDDSANEFLNSSSFLSNSQIIRTDNLNNYKPVSQKTISSPTPGVKASVKSTKKNHFQLTSANSVSTQLSDPSDQSDHDDDDNFNRGKAEDIDIDNPKSTPKLPKIHPDTTPWRKLRPQSALPSKEPQTQQLSVNFMKSLFDDDNDAVRSPTRSVSLFENTSNSDSIGTTTVTTSYEIENLKKQITNYKLQLRLLTEFIRNIIRNTGSGEVLKNDIMERLERENDILFGEREKLQKDLKDTIGQHEQDESEKLAEKMKEIVELKNDLIATRDLNAELNSYIDELKARTEDQERVIDKSNDDSDKWESLINGVLTLLLDFLRGESAKAALQTRDQSHSIDTKLKVLSLSVNEVLENYERLSENISKTSGYDAETISSFIEESQIKIKSSKKIEQDLRKLTNEQADTLSSLKTEFSSLQVQFKENLLFVASLKKLLAEKRAKIAELNEVVIRLEAQLEEQSAFQSTNTGNEKEAKLLRNRLTIIKTNHSKEIESLHSEIDNLNLKIDEMGSKGRVIALDQNSSHRSSDLEALETEIQTLKQRLDSKDDHAESAISNLKNLLRQTKEDYTALLQDYSHLERVLKESQSELQGKDKEYRKKLEHAAKELNLAVAKQRTLAAEKSKLTFAIEELKREHSLLKLNNSTLTEKVGKLSYQVSQLTNYELGFNSLFQLQTSNFQNLLHHFESILEESSVNQAQQKLNKLDDANLDFDQVHGIMRSLFSYFENATSSLISDHSQLLVNSNMDYKDSQSEISDLKRQIDSLNEELQWYIVNFKGDQNDLSPRSKLRVNELEKRRKAERERRKLENQAAEETIRRLEKENKELKEKLRQIR